MNKRIYFWLEKNFTHKIHCEQKNPNPKFNISLLHKNDCDLLSIYIDDIIKKNKN